VSKSSQFHYNTDVDLPQVLDILDQQGYPHPLAELTAGNAFRTLVGCIISLRTKDEVTLPACQRLFALADSPQALLDLSLAQVETLIYPAGFYKTKALTLQNACQKILSDFSGQVPQSIEALLTFKGVGRKTANLVVGLGHGLPAICVDIHVHRICNRLGVVTSEDPEATEWALRTHLPVAYWEKINWLMVLHGQRICRPIGAWCDVCAVANLCQQVAVKKRKPPEPSSKKQAPEIKRHHFDYLR
jgi:endonuclease-3